MNFCIAANTRVTGLATLWLGLELELELSRPYGTWGEWESVEIDWLSPAALSSVWTGFRRKHSTSTATAPGRIASRRSAGLYASQ